MEALRIDLVFSYWIFIWYLLYIFKFISYSPKFPLIIGLVDNIIMFIMMLTYGTSYKTIIYFVIINTFIKVMPLYYLRNNLIKMRDIYFTIILFTIFIIWLHINSQSLIGNTKTIYDSLLYGKNKTPFIDFMNIIQNNFKNMKIL
jgi:hypothetical protein